jgi:hypothetical protein
MNPRTITHNPQLDNLIGAIQPKSQPAPLSATWPVLHERAMITAKIANSTPIQVHDTGFFDLYLLFALLFAVLIYCYRRS